MDRVADRKDEAFQKIRLCCQPATQNSGQFKLDTLAVRRPVANVGLMYTWQRRIECSVKARGPQRFPDGIAQIGCTSAQPDSLTAVILASMDRNRSRRPADKVDRVRFVEKMRCDVKVPVRPGLQGLKGIERQIAPGDCLGNFGCTRFYRAAVRGEDHRGRAAIL